MNKFYLFIIRAILSECIAFIIMRIYRPEANPFYIIGLGIILLGLAYGLESFRKKTSNS